MKWFITGGAGFIGQNLVNKLVEIGEKVTVYDNFSVGKLENVHPNANIVVGDILDTVKLTNYSQNYDIMVHLAAQTSVPQSVEDPVDDFTTNTIGTFNCLEACFTNDIKKFVFASSSAPAGVTEPPINEEKPARPMSPYGASKLAGEGYCSCYYHSYGINTVALRFANVYGEHSGGKTSVVAKWIERIDRGEGIEIYGDGLQTRDFIYVGDLVNAIIMSAVHESIGGEVFQVATGIETALIDLLRMIREHIKTDFKVEYTDPLKGDIKNNYCDITKIKKYFGWEPKMELTKGIQQTIEWFQRNNQTYIL